MKRISLSCLAISLTLVSTARADINSVLSQWNLVTFGNLNQMGEVEGSSYIGGDVNQTTSFQFAMGNYSTPSSSVTVAVAGNVVSGNPINVNHGSVVVGGSSNSRMFNMNSGGTASSGSSWPAANSPLSQLSAASSAMSTMSANSSISIDQNNGVVFNCDANASLAVFNVTDMDTFERSNVQGFNLNPGALTSTILINVNSLDGSVDWTQGNFFNLFQQDNWQGRVLFNFYNATSLNLHDQFTGYVLAPNADVTAGSHNIDGGLVCNNLLSIGEVHLPNQNGDSSSWNGPLPTTQPVPEPATGALAMLGLAFFAGMRRMKR